ncbi:MAG: PHP domain-containing protein [Actinobacteria bacterium]|jgi:predicted metal-dependent phosphoesterase TrpH|nr:MAG: PHP domain-containing protein [Actinomycetota bacterium]
MAKIFIVDLHIHTSLSSFCSDLSTEDMFAEAKRLGLDAVAVTEHSTFHGARVACDAGLEKGFPVFKGVEVYTTGGDMLVFGVETEIWPDMDFEELLQAVLESGGLIIAAHPTRGYWGHHRRYKGFPPREVLELVHAVETLNGGCSYQENVQATRLAAELGLPQVGGSDAHSISQIGRCVTVFPRAIQGDDDLKRMIGEGNCTAAYLQDILTVPDTAIRI